MSTTTPTPFKIAVPDELLNWIDDRVRTTRLPQGGIKDLPTKDTWYYGLPLATATKLHNHWTQNYDWRSVERKLNEELQQFTLPIDHDDETLTVHFVHHRSTHPDAIPLLFIHGWPGSFLEVKPIISQLTTPSDPTQQAYHVVAPSLLGFGFSSYPLKPFSPMDQGSVLHTLMQRLGYDTFMTQGGDWGSIISRIIAIAHPTSCPAIHVNMIAASPPSALWQPLSFAKMILTFATSVTATAYEKKLLDRLLWWQRDEFGYSSIQGTKPQTVQYALTDSPFGFVCWIRDKLEHLVDYDAGWRWTEEEVITMVMPYIINGSPGHAEIYKWAHNDEQKALVAAAFTKQVPQTSFFGASIFPKDVIYAPRWWAEATVASNIVFWKEHDRGGHFPSLETPDVLVADIREFTGKIDGVTWAKLRGEGK